MDIRGLDPTIPLQQTELAKQRVIKGGEKFPALKPETFTPATTKTAQQSEAVVTPEEKEYFAALFPESSPDIAAHVTYSPRGLSGGPVQTGSMIDRKV